jgi:hypothetical protein
MSKIIAALVIIAVIAASCIYKLTYEKPVEGWWRDFGSYVKRRFLFTAITTACALLLVVFLVWLFKRMGWE